MLNEKINEPQKKSRFKNLFLQVYYRFIRLRDTPEQIAWGVAIGFFIAMTPTLGFQTYIVIPLAALIGVSKVAAAISVWLTNPLTAPFFYGFNYMIGAMILGYPFKVDVFTNPSWIEIFHSGRQVLYALLVGGTITGIIFGVAGYFFTEGMIRTAREKAKELKKIKEKIPVKAADLKKIKEKIHVQTPDLKKIKEKLHVPKLKK